MTDETTNGDGLGLADVLQALGAELREAQQRGGGTIAWMNAELEMEVAVDTTGSGGVRFWVVNADAARGVTPDHQSEGKLDPAQRRSTA